jgi:hypothetical protein
LVLAALTALTLPARAPAQKRDTIEITGVRVGYPPAPQFRDDPSALGTIYKHGFWTPIYVDLQCNKTYTSNVKLVVAAPDGDDVPARYEVVVPQMQPGTSEMVIGYARPGGSQSDLSIVLERF